MDGRDLEEWSNEEVRRALIACGETDVPVTQTTRPFLLRKLHRLLDKKENESADSKGEKDDEESPNSVSAPPKQLVHDTKSFEGYFGVAAVGCDESSATIQLSPYYTSKAEVLKAIKNLPGARFKRFESQQSAEAFSHQRANESASDSIDLSSSPASAPNPSPGEKANSFPSVKTQLLTKFRKLIESGDAVQFADTVWSNPRHLITSGDAPEILH